MKHLQIFVKLAKIALGLALAILILIFIGEKVFNATYKFPQRQDYGVTFSPKFAKQLNLDPRQTFIKILDEIKVKKIRLPSYWDIIEKDEKDDFEDLDFMLSEAQKRETKVILVLGVRQPRWPECHIPAWAKNLSVSERQEKALEFIRIVVQKYKNHLAIFAWQVENEPLLSDFGQGCDKPDRNFLIKEVELVRSMDKRSIILTDSGELGWWITSMKLSDIFGTTVYRTVYNKIFGFVKYPLLPYFYNVKSYLVRSIFASSSQKTIIVELQAEPWSSTNTLEQTKLEDQIEVFSIKDFENIVKYAKDTGFDTAYLWGVEWWYWMERQGYPEYLEYAKGLFR